jgi:hypothetical protein
MLLYLCIATCTAKQNQNDRKKYEQDCNSFLQSITY